MPSQHACRACSVMHFPAQHTSVGPQVAPQSPQFCTLVCRLEHWSSAPHLLESTSHSQVPFTQIVFIPQLRPQVPQLNGSVSRLVHSLAQQASCFGWQWAPQKPQFRRVIGCVQIPFSQHSLKPHGELHDPQLLRSLIRSTHADPCADVQHAAPPVHASSQDPQCSSTCRFSHDPPQQPSVGRQMLSHPPQLFRSSVGSIQIPLQLMSGSGHTQSHVSGSFTRGGVHGFGHTHPHETGSCTLGSGHATGVHTQPQTLLPSRLPTRTPT